MARRELNIIAELGSNPAPDWWNLDLWCSEAQWTGADLVKVQIFDPKHFPEGERESKRRVQFPLHHFRKFVQLSFNSSMGAGASVFSRHGMEEVLHNGDFVKLASREEKNYPLLEQIKYYNDRKIPVYRSSTTIESLGWSTVYGFTPLFCIPQYPTLLWKTFFPIVQAARFLNSLGIRWGWSSHTKSKMDCLLAVKLGATVIEKHFALTEQDVEAGHSLLPAQFKQMVENSRRLV